MGLSKGFLNSTTPCLPFIMVIGPWQDAGPYGAAGSEIVLTSTCQCLNISQKNTEDRKTKNKNRNNNNIQQPPLPPHLHYISPLIQSQVALKNLMNPNPKGLAQARTCGCGGCAKPVSKALYLSDASRGCHDKRTAVN